MNMYILGVIQKNSFAWRHLKFAIWRTLAANITLVYPFLYLIYTQSINYNNSDGRLWKDKRLGGVTPFIRTAKLHIKQLMPSVLTHCDNYTQSNKYPFSDVACSYSSNDL